MHAQRPYRSLTQPFTWCPCGVCWHSHSSAADCDSVGWCGVKADMTIQVLGLPRTSASHEHSSIGQAARFGKWLRARDELLTATGNPIDLPMCASLLNAAFFRPVLAGGAGSGAGPFCFTECVLLPRLTGEQSWPSWGARVTGDLHQGMLQCTVPLILPRAFSVHLRVSIY